MAINAVIVDSISGISIKSYREIRQAIATSFTEVFDASINLEPSSPDGMTTYLKENITDGITFKENTKNETVGGIPAHSFVIFVPATFSTEDIDPSDKDWQAIILFFSFCRFFAFSAFVRQKNRAEGPVAICLWIIACFLDV